jgi:hypothetical protein
VVAEFAIRNVDHNSTVDLRPIGIARQENELCLRVDEVLD